LQTDRKALLATTLILTIFLLCAATTSEIFFMSFPSLPPATVAPLSESQENSTFESRHGLSASLVATVVCAASVALVVLLGFAYRQQKQSVAHRTSSDTPAPDEFGSPIKEFPMHETQSLVLDETDVTSTVVCAPGFDRAMLETPAASPASDAQSNRYQDPLEPLCPSSEPAECDSSLYTDPRPLVPTPSPRYRSLDEPEADANFRRRRPSDQGIIAEIVRKDSARHLERSESEDENVPMRVIDLIRFFTPLRPLEPPGNTRGR
jgi:hypothetical protein